MRRNKQTNTNGYRTTKEQENWEKEACIIGGESEALGFHQETTEDSRKRQDWFCINFTLFCTKLASFWLYSSRKRN